MKTKLAALLAIVAAIQVLEVAASIAMASLV